jgi:hypothetical protein
VFLPKLLCKKLPKILSKILTLGRFWDFLSSTGVIIRKTKRFVGFRGAQPNLRKYRGNYSEFPRYHDRAPIVDSVWDNLYNLFHLHRKNDRDRKDSKVH